MTENGDVKYVYLETKMKIHPISSAFHEAGHVVAANVLGYRVDLAAVYAEPLYMGQASLLDEKMYELGGVNILWPSDISGRERDVIMVDLAGPAAAMRRAKKRRPIQTKIWADDLGQAILMATRIASTHEEGETLINELFKRARKLLGAHWPKVEAVATALLERQTLGELDLQRIIREQ